jgi:hypothetical protein
MDETEDFEQVTDKIKETKRQNINVSRKSVLKLHMLSLYFHKPMGRLVDNLVDDCWDKNKDKMAIIPKKKVKKPVNEFLNSIRESIGLKRVE